MRVEKEGTTLCLGYSLVQHLLLLLHNLHRERKRKRSVISNTVKPLNKGHHGDTFFF